MKTKKKHPEIIISNGNFPFETNIYSPWVIRRKILVFDVEFRVIQQNSLYLIEYALIDEFKAKIKARIE